MRNVFIILIFCICQFSSSFGKEIDSSEVFIQTAEDSIEYELLVFDLGYETFLLTQPSMEFYSESYYKSWNEKYVIEWNYRHNSQASTGLYESYIDYDPNTEYGIELEYRLYYYFLYFEEVNGVKLIQRAR